MTVIVCKGKLFLCIAEVNGLFIDHQPIDDIPFAVLAEKATQVLYQALCLVPGSCSDDHNAKHNWRSFNLSHFSEKVPGTLVLPINPDVTSPKLGNAFFLFKSSDLIAFATRLQDSICGRHRKAIPQVEASDWFPYQEQDSKSSCC